MLQHKPIKRNNIGWITKSKWLIIAILLFQVQLSFSQKLGISLNPYKLGETIIDLPLNNIINYKTDTASISSFGEKLIVLDFWNIHCSSCIEKFPLEDSLQRKYKDKIQYILVAWEPKTDIQEFIQKWETEHHMKLSIPMVTNDRVLHKLFPSFANPFYVWIAPNGRILSSSMGDVVNETYIQGVLQSFKEKKRKFTPLKKPTTTESEFIKFFQR